MVWWPPRGCFHHDSAKGEPASWPESAGHAFSEWVSMEQPLAHVREMSKLSELAHIERH